MKYKGIELKEGMDSEAELLVDVGCTKEFDNEKDLEELMEEIEDSILEVFADFPEEIYTEAVCGDLLQVRCNAITFDRKGVALLTDIYKIVAMLMIGTKGVTVGIAVHVDGDVWFENKDGTTYNEDSVTLEEFLANVEY